MTQLFGRNANALAWVSIVGVTLIFGALVAVGVGWYLSPYYTQVGIAKEQPVPFSHQHHVAELKIDCRYCHVSVEDAAYAGIPPTETCMSCHSQVWTTSPLLQPVRDSYTTGEPILWERIHNLPDYVYFNHSIHVNKGIGCTTCHGAVDEMHLTYKSQELWMGWCLGCHRNPELYVRPQEEVFNVDWTPPANQTEQGTRLVEEYHIRTDGSLEDCYTCHR